MTSLLLAKGSRVAAMELDAALIAELQRKFARGERITILPADVLATDLVALCRQSHVDQCFVFGNLPYYITSPILHHLFRQAACIRAMGLLVQREVAERIAASPGRRAYGYLSVLAQLFSHPRVALVVPPGAFSPPPRVHSALVQFEMAPRFPTWTGVERTQFLEFVKRCFAQKRKSLLNNLSRPFWRSCVQRALEGLALPATTRAEQLTLEQFAALFEVVVLRPPRGE
jgi:16S rRNA (adenine1518-N6/adenine1519-N6)-dimethyltransferase